MRPLPYTLIAIHITALSAALWATHVRVGDMQAECPATIPATAFKPDRPPAGWIGFAPSQAHLSAAGMMAGPPETMSYLVPQEETMAKQTWRFDQGDGERWMWCAYGGAGGLRLARRLDDKALSCTITTKREKRQGQVPSFAASVQCR